MKNFVENAKTITEEFDVNLISLGENEMIFGSKATDLIFRVVADDLLKSVKVDVECTQNCGCCDCEVAVDMEDFLAALLNDQEAAQLTLEVKEITDYSINDIIEAVEEELGDDVQSVAYLVDEVTVVCDNYSVYLKQDGDIIDVNIDTINASGLYSIDDLYALVDAMEEATTRLFNYFNA